MTFAKTFNSALILSAAFQGSSAAVLPDRRFLHRAAQVDVADHKEREVVMSSPGRILSDEIARHERRGSHGIVDVVERAPQNVEVAETDMLQLIDDVRAVELQMQDWLSGVTVVTPSLSADGVLPAESDNPAVEDVDLPTVSDPSQDELNNDIGDSDVETAAPTDNREALSSDGCMMTVTQTFTEFIFYGPSSSDVAFRAGNETASVDLIAFEASLTVSLPFDAGLESTPIPLESGALEGLPSESVPEDENLAPFALSGDLEALPTSPLEELRDVAAPSITPPPAVTDEPILEGGEETSEGEIDLLGEEEDRITEDSLEATEEEVTEVEDDGNQEGEDEGDENGQQAVTPPTEMTLRFPGEGASGIVWRTISLPSV